MKATTRRNALLIGGGLVVIGVAFVVVVFLLVQNSSPEVPRITAFADGRSVTVEPYLNCPVAQPLCPATGEIANVPVRSGHPLQLSLPKAIFNAPWVLATVYTDSSNANPVETDTQYRPGAQFIVTVPPVDGAGRALAGVEVRLPTGVIDPDTKQEIFVSHAIWSIATTAQPAK